MAYGDLSQFLPKAEGEKLNVAQAQAEATKRASYLSSMDQFYASLEETQRQFDIQQDLANRQFTWMSGFEETKLEQEGEIAREQIALGERTRRDEARYREGMLELEGEKLDLAEKEQDYMQWYKSEELDLAWEKFGLEEDLVQTEIGPKPISYRRPIGGAIGTYRTDFTYDDSVFGGSSSRRSRYNRPDYAGYNY